jgi:hypothetical protein
MITKRIKQFKVTNLCSLPIQYIYMPNQTLQKKVYFPEQD